LCLFYWRCSIDKDEVNEMYRTHKGQICSVLLNGTSAANSLLWRSTCRQEDNFEKGCENVDFIVTSLCRLGQ